jgi:glutathione synthase/RimK-type ligase-like ATP-grasp enzyme
VDCSGAAASITCVSEAQEVKHFVILDERDVWWRGAIDAARRAGYVARRIGRGEEVGRGADSDSGGIGFIRPHADPAVLTQNYRDYKQMVAAGLCMIQDPMQLDVYENKTAQWVHWGEWMPPTQVHFTLEEALSFLQRTEFPLVSKADVGASSVNVRILANREDAEAHVRAIFGAGVSVDHCSSNPGGTVRSLQRGYALLQKFIPHEVTWRVNAIGDARAIFRRFNYPHKPVAQTGNVEPVMAMTEEVESLLEFANRFFAHAETKWCALDVLRDGNTWRLLETSLAWPWPSPGDCNSGPIFGSHWKWIGMFDALFDQIEAGAFAPLEKAA